MANTQVHDGFFVKHTADTASTIAYLVLMTRKIEEMFTDVTLVAGDDSSDLHTMTYLNRCEGLFVAHVLCDDSSDLYTMTYLNRCEGLFVARVLCDDSPSVFYITHVHAVQ
jgi:hypothetical protein